MAVEFERETVDNTKLRIIPGEVVNLGVPDDGDMRWFRSRLEDCGDANEWLRLHQPQVSDAAPLDLRPGSQVVVQIPQSYGALYSARLVIDHLDEATGEGAATFTARPVGSWNRIQRRQAVRVPVVIRPSRAERITPQGWKPLGALIANLSAGGALLRCSELVEYGDTLELAFPLGDGGAEIVTRATVVRVQHVKVGKKQHWDAGCAFEGLRLSDSDRIVRFVFAEQRALAQKRWHA